jgi:hypothetical protein
MLRAGKVSARAIPSPVRAFSRSTARSGAARETVFRQVLVFIRVLTMPYSHSISPQKAPAKASDNDADGLLTKPPHCIGLHSRWTTQPSAGCPGRAEAWATQAYLAVRRVRTGRRATKISARGQIGQRGWGGVPYVTPLIGSSIIACLRVFKASWQRSMALRF